MASALAAVEFSAPDLRPLTFFSGGGGFLMMNDVSLCRRSSGVRAPHALQSLQASPALALTTKKVSGFLHEPQRTN